MSTAKATTQTAAERRSAEAELDGLVSKFAPAQAKFVAAARRWLRKRLPAAHEMVYEYRDCFVISCSPSGRGFEGVLALRGSADGLRLYFGRGKDLPDPAKLLQGAGTQTRWIPLESAATFARPEVVQLVDAAIERNEVPFASSGRGPVVIQSKKPAAKRGAQQAARGAKARTKSAAKPRSRTSAGARRTR